MSLQSERDDLFAECKMAAKANKAMREELGNLKDDIENLTEFSPTFASGSDGPTKWQHAVREAARHLRNFKKGY